MRRRPPGREKEKSGRAVAACAGERLVQENRAYGRRLRESGNGNAPRTGQREKLGRKAAWAESGWSRAKPRGGDLAEMVKNAGTATGKMRWEAARAGRAASVKSLSEKRPCGGS